MKKITAGLFKLHCLSLLDQIQAKRETVVITKQGKVVAKLVPVAAAEDEVYGFLAGKGTITGDIVFSGALARRVGQFEVMSARLRRVELRKSWSMVGDFFPRVDSS